MYITGENYPIYFLDFYEGVLTDGQVAELMNFLKQNPYLQHEFDSFESIKLDNAPNIKIPDKEMLKKGDSLPPLMDTSLDNYCIAAMEGDLDQNQEESFRLFVNENYQRLKTYNLYQKTRIAANNDSRFPSKSAVKMFIPDQDSPNTSSLMSIENAIIAYHEGDLNEKEKLRLLHYISTDWLTAREFNEYQKSRLRPDMKVSFPHKAKLKHHSFVSDIKKVWHYAAALLIPVISISLYYILSNPVSTDEAVVNNTSQTTGSTDWKKPATPPPATEINMLVAQTIAPQYNANPYDKQQTKKLDSIERHSNGEIPGELTTLYSLVHAPFEVALYKPAIIPKTEFANWIAMGFYDHSETAEIVKNLANQPENNNSFLSNLALLGIEKISGIDIYQTTGRIITRDLSFWDFAGAGLAGISQLTGTSWVVNKDLDENGRISLIEIGENIRVER